MSKPKNYVIILASGNSERLKDLRAVKQFTKIAGKTVIEHTIEIFEKNKLIDEIIIVTKENYIEFCNSLITTNNYKKISKVLKGGETRRESSSIGLFSIDASDNDNVLIHDAVRPFLTDDIINNCIDSLKLYNAVDVAIDSADTIIQVNDSNIIEDIPKRKYLKRGQTPQAFKLGVIKKAHKLANECENIDVTDDCGLIKKFDLGEIYVVKGNDYNIKITYPLDIDIADKLFQIRTFDTPISNIDDIQEKVIVVFGASSGIGKSITELSKKYNAKVYGFSRTNGVDITNPKNISDVLEQVFKKEQRIDYVVNTVGVLKTGVLDLRDYNDINNEITTNYIGSINVIKESVKYLKQSQGSILLFSSSSYTRGRAEYSIYSSTKAALVNLTQAVSQEISKDNVRINIINPERTATPMRYNNFGKEDEKTLLSPNTVAIASLLTLLSNLSGQVINVTLEKEKELNKYIVD